MKMQRYDAYHIGLHPSDDGGWCDSEDVAALEAKYAELLAAAEEVMCWWRFCFGESVHVSMDKLRDAIAKAKQSDDNQTTTTNGEQP